MIDGVARPRAWLLVAAIFALTSPQGVAQTDSWMISLSAWGGWSDVNPMVLDSDGTVVEYDRKNNPLRCGSLTTADLSYLRERIDQARQSDTEARRWHTTATDIDHAELTIRWSGSESNVFIVMPLATALIEGSPPGYLVELVQRVLRLRAAAERACDTNAPGRRP
jgi:hypothetical protein